jgi:hypothetical protein
MFDDHLKVDLMILNLEINRACPQDLVLRIFHSYWIELREKFWRKELAIFCKELSPSLLF